MDNREIEKHEAFCGAFIQERYRRCPHLEKKCRWRMGKYGGGYEWLNDTCYLSGSFPLECPEEEYEHN